MPTAVCVPGLGLQASAWTPTVRALPGGGHQVVPLPGYGVPAPPGTALEPAALGRRLASALEALLGAAGEPVVLMGHSASCQVVAHAAALAPDHVSDLVLVGPTTDPRARSWPALAARWTRTAAWERPGQVPVLARSYPRTGWRSMARAMDAARRDDLREPLARARRPVLVVRGAHDRICPHDWAERVAGSGPAGSSATTLGAGAHMVPLTHGPLLAAAVVAGLR